MQFETSPIFIISALNRSGTNYLANILTATGEYAIPENIGEDYLMVYSDKLESYFLETTKHWSKHYRENSRALDDILAKFGIFFEEFFLERIPTSKRLLLKCPRPYNISNIFKFFPNAKVLIVERSAKDTISSFFSSFPEYSFYQSVDLFFKGSCELNAFFTKNKESGQVMKVKYKDLINNNEVAISALGEFCNVPRSSLDPINQPLIGSSELKKQEGHIHWKPIEKPKNFNPVGRYKNWSLYKKIIYRLLKLKYSSRFPEDTVF